MKKAKFWCLLIIIHVILLPFVAPLDALEYVPDRNVLKGLDQINVIIENMDDDAIDGGLNKTQIQSDVELKLRQNGIRVLPDAEILGVLGSPRLYVNINIVCSSNGFSCAYNISLSVLESCILERDSNIVYTGATTWDKGITGIIGTSRLREIRDVVKDLVDIFLNDYLAANPK